MKQQAVAQATVSKLHACVAGMTRERTIGSQTREATAPPPRLALQPTNPPPAREGGRDRRSRARRESHRRHRRLKAHVMRARTRNRSSGRRTTRKASPTARHRAESIDAAPDKTPGTCTMAVRAKLDTRTTPPSLAQRPCPREESTGLQTQAVLPALLSQTVWPCTGAKIGSNSFELESATEF